MGIIAVKPLYLEESDLLIDADDFAAALSAAAITPQTATATFRGLKKDATFSDAHVTGHTCDLTFVQDWESAVSLSKYLKDNAGQKKDITVVPKTGGPGFKVNVTILPGPIGGAAGAHATATVSLPVHGDVADVPPVVVP